MVRPDSLSLDYESSRGRSRYGSRSSGSTLFSSAQGEVDNLKACVVLQSSFALVKISESGPIDREDPRDPSKDAADMKYLLPMIVTELLPVLDSPKSE